MVGFILNFLLLVIATLPVAHASITLEPQNGATDETSSTSSTRTIYFPIQGDGTCDPTLSSTVKSFQDALSDLTIIDSSASASDSDGIFKFTISTSKTRSEIYDGTTTTTVPSNDDVFLRVELSGNNNNKIPLYVNTGSFSYTTSNQPYNVRYTSDNQTITFGISLADDPNSITANGYCDEIVASGAGLTTNCQFGPSGSPSTQTLVFGFTNSNLSNTNADTLTVNIVGVDCPPHSGGSLTEPTLNFGMVVGDQRVKIVNTSTEPTDPVGLSKVLVVATATTSCDPSTPSTCVTLSNADVVKEFDDETGGIYTVDGLTNDVQYCFSLSYVNKGGLVSTNSTTWDDTLPVLSSTDTTQFCATPSQIDGFLQRSTCFIASAAYGDEWDPRLEILRQFRDQILDHFSLGRSFVHWYYSWSPSAANWLFDNPGYKSIVRVVLIPLVESARVALWLKSHMWAFGLALLLGTAAMVWFRRRFQTENA